MYPNISSDSDLLYQMAGELPEFQIESIEEEIRVAVTT